MSNLEKLRSEERQLGLTLAAVSLRYEATSQLYLAAVMQKNYEEADKLRQQLHVLLDQRLDAQSRQIDIAVQVKSHGPG